MRGHWVLQLPVSLLLSQEHVAIPASFLQPPIQLLSVNSSCNGSLAFWFVFLASLSFRMPHVSRLGYKCYLACRYQIPTDIYAFFFWVPFVPHPKKSEESLLLSKCSHCCAMVRLVNQLSQSSLYVQLCVLLHQIKEVKLNKE